MWVLSKVRRTHRLSYGIHTPRTVASQISLQRLTTGSWFTQHFMSLEAHLVGDQDHCSMLCQVCVIILGVQVPDPRECDVVLLPFTCQSLKQVLVDCTPKANKDLWPSGVVTSLQATDSIAQCKCVLTHICVPHIPEATYCVLPQVCVTYTRLAGQRLGKGCQILKAGCNV
jgi:hypothetical protein